MFGHKWNEKIKTATRANSQEDQGAHNWAHGAPLRRKARAFCALKGIRYCVSFTFLSHSLCLYDYHRLYAHVCISLSLGWSSIQMKANEFTVIRFRNLNVNWRLKEKSDINSAVQFFSAEQLRRLHETKLYLSTCQR